MPRTALAPAVSLGLLALFLFLSGLSAFLATAQGQTMDGNTEGERGAAPRFVSRQTVYNIDPGDHAEISMQWSTGTDEAAPHTRILVVEGGEGDAYFDGREAAHVLEETTFPKASGLVARHGDSVYGPILFRFERPDVYSGKPHAQGLNGDLHSAIDIVVVYERPSGMSQATWESSRSSIAEATSSMSIDVAHEPWVALQWVWLPLAALSAVAAVLTGVAWLRASRADSQAAPDDVRDLEGLVAMQARAFGYLRGLRNTMRVSGALLVAGGLGSLVAFAGLADGTHYDPWDTWAVFVVGAAFLTLAGAVAVWTIQYRRIAREVKRWQATPSPLDA